MSLILRALYSWGDKQRVILWEGTLRVPAVAPLSFSGTHWKSGTAAALTPHFQGSLEGQPQPRRESAWLVHTSSAVSAGWWPRKVFTLARPHPFPAKVLVYTIMRVIFMWGSWNPPFLVYSSYVFIWTWPKFLSFLFIIFLISKTYKTRGKSHQTTQWCPCISSIWLSQVPTFYHICFSILPLYKNFSCNIWE